MSNLRNQRKKQKETKNSLISISNITLEAFVLKKEYILLSADGEVSLYQVTKDIESNLEKVIEDFFKWKTTKSYDETLFVKFLINRFGKDSVSFVEVVGGYLGSPNSILKDGKDVTEEYKNIKWFNF